MPEIVEYDFARADADGSLLVRVADGRVFVCLHEQIRPFALAVDADAFAALQRAMDSNPDLFRLVERRPVLAVPEVSVQPTFTSDLTDQDRKRLRAITLKHWRFYFAEHPTTAQLDQLIDSLGPEVGAKLVKKQLDAGTIH